MDPELVPNPTRLRVLISKSSGLRSRGSEVRILCGALGIGLESRAASTGAPATRRGARGCPSRNLPHLTWADVAVTKDETTHALARKDSDERAASVSANRSARFCGVVTGLYDDSNSGVGVGHAVQMVGMFDLPENKPAKTADKPAP